MPDNVKEGRVRERGQDDTDTTSTDLAPADPDTEPVAVTVDPLTRIRAIIDAETQSGNFRIRELAEAIVHKLTLNEPELLLAFLQDYAVDVIVNLIRQTMRSQRAHARHQQPRSTFAEAVRNHEAGRQGGPQLADWLKVRYRTGDNDQWKPLGKCTAEDLEWPVRHHASAAASHAMEAAFLKALQARIGADRVEDHFTNEEIERIRASLTP